MKDKLDLLQRFFNNKYSQDDYFRLKKMVLDEDKELVELMAEHWENFALDNTRQKKDLSVILSDINSRQKKRSIQNDHFSKIIKYYSRIAAILMLPLLLLSAILILQLNQYLKQKDVYVEVNSPSGSRTALNLPDGSLVWLNGNSRIRYPVDFGEDRHVEVKGEAFFHVHSDKEHPFLVKANEIMVRATGTEFDVSAYEDDPEVSVILKEGKVAVLDVNQSLLKEMEAGYQLKYDRQTSSANYRQVNAENYSGWINGRLIFENAPMSEVIRRMSRWYGVRIKVKDEELLNLHFKATFTNESLEEALKLLQSTATFHYRIDTGRLKPDGSHQSSNVFITKNP